MGNNGDESFTLEDFLTYASDKESRNEKYNNVKLNNNDIDFFLDQAQRSNHYDLLFLILEEKHPILPFEVTYLYNSGIFFYFEKKNGGPRYGLRADQIVVNDFNKNRLLIHKKIPLDDLTTETIPLSSTSNWYYPLFKKFIKGGGKKTRKQKQTRKEKRNKKKQKKTRKRKRQRKTRRNKSFRSPIF